MDYCTSGHKLTTSNTILIPRKTTKPFKRCRVCAYARTRAWHLKTHPPTREHVPSLVGQRFGRWLVQRRAANNAKGKSRWKCLCDCGNSGVVERQSLRKGVSLSCGCLSRERSTTHGMSHTPTHNSWVQMMRRCVWETDYEHYSSRGIKVCKRWYKFENFLADMGERPEGTSIDRYPNNNGNYEPKNCRWATPKEQQNNTRRNVSYTWNDKTLTIAQWTRELPIGKLLRSRLNCGWTFERAATTPLQRRAA